MSPVARAFAAAAPRYDAAAKVQRVVARSLAARAPSARRILEIGCGTGFLTAELLARLPGCTLLATDLAPEMVAACRASLPDARLECRVMDGMWPDQPPGAFDLVVSSLAFQWFEDLEAALARLAALLAPGGKLVFATLGADTFREWRDAHRDLGLPCGARLFPEAVALSWPAGGGGTVEEERLRAEYPDALSFLRGLKTIGAHLPEPGHRPLAPGDLRRVLRRTGTTITWHVLYGCWEKAA